MRALTRAVPPSVNHCELSHIERLPIDDRVAGAQHDRYENELRSLGCTVERLVPLPDSPDSVFVEDTAVVLDELAMITRPGAERRRAETASVADALRPHRPLVFVQAPATLDGGDVLRIGKRIFVGRTSRTNEDGIRQLRDAVGGFGYTVQDVPVQGCLHLKSAATLVAANTVLVNSEWLDVETFAGLERIEVDPAEQFAANALRIGGTVLFPVAYPRTGRRLESSGITLRLIDMSELAKAEGGLTCCSIMLL